MGLDDLAGDVEAEAEAAERDGAVGPLERLEQLLARLEGDADAVVFGGARLVVDRLRE